MGGPRLQDRGPDGHAHLGLGRVTGRIWTDARRHGMPVGHPAVVKISLTIPAHTLACRAEPPSGTAARVHLVLACRDPGPVPFYPRPTSLPGGGEGSDRLTSPIQRSVVAASGRAPPPTAGPAAAPPRNSPPWDLAGMAACADRPRASRGGRAFPGPTGPTRVSRRRGGGVDLAQWVSFPARAGSCPQAWCSCGVATTVTGRGRDDQAARVGRLTRGSSLIGAMLSRVR